MKTGTKVKTIILGKTFFGEVETSGVWPCEDLNGRKYNEEYIRVRYDTPPKSVLFPCIKIDKYTDHVVTFRSETLQNVCPV